MKFNLCDVSGVSYSKACPKAPILYCLQAFLIKIGGTVKDKTTVFEGGQSAVFINSEASLIINRVTYSIGTIIFMTAAFSNARHMRFHGEVLIQINS